MQLTAEFGVTTEEFQTFPVENFIIWNVTVSKLYFFNLQQPNLEISHHAEKTLASFCKWQLSVNPKDETHPNHHDVAILLTRLV